MSEPKGMHIWAVLRRLLFRNTMAALIATVAEFVVVTLLQWLPGVTPWLATAIGCLFGGIVNFIINRKWTFQSQAPGSGQALRYGLVSVAGAALAYVGVEQLCRIMDWRLAWGLTHIVCSWGWHLPLQRYFVFGRPAYQMKAPR